MVPSEAKRPGRPQVWTFVVLFAVVSLSSCNRDQPMKPDFDKALESHFAAIENRDLEAFQAHLTSSDHLYTIVQNGHAFTTPAETIAIHEQWFQDPNWIWEGSVVHKVVGEDMAMALMKYEYRAKPDDEPFSTWLTYVFRLEDGQWKIIHDHNTALNYAAFAKSAGIAIE